MGTFLAESRRGCPARSRIDQIGRVHPDIATDANDAHRPCATTGLRLVLLLFDVQRGQHGGVPPDPIFETGGDAECRCAPEGDVGVDVRTRAGTLGCVLPADERKHNVLHSVHGTEIMNVGVVERKTGRTQTKK